jgi:hypothetical protein
LAEYNQRIVPSLIYKVQIAALSTKENFINNTRNELGAIELIKLGYGLIRLTLGRFTILLEVKNLLGKVKIAGYTDAFIIAFLDGKRTYLEKLEKIDVVK